MRRPSVFSANALYLLAIVGLMLTGLFSQEILYGIFALFPNISSECAILLMNAVYYVPFMLLPAALYAGKNPDCAVLRLNPVSFRATVFLVLTAIIGVFLTSNISYFWSVLLESIGLHPYVTSAIPSGMDANGMMLYIASAAILPGICEEMLCRGVLLSAWEPRRGTLNALRYTAILFALTHGSLQGLPSQFLLGYAMAYLVTAFDSLYAGMIYHTTHNAAVVLLSVAAEKFAPTVAQTAAAVSPNLALTLFECVYLLAAYAALLSLCRRRMAKHRVILFHDAHRRMTAQEWLMLLSALLTTAVLYGEDMLLLLKITS